MNTTNREIIEKYYEYSNAQQLDKAAELVSESAIIHGSDYVGMGVTLDTSSGDKVIITKVYEGGPSIGILEPGDVITRVKIHDRILEGFEELSEQAWGLGKLGEEVNLSILRFDAQLEVSIRRGRVPAQVFSYQEAIKNLGKYYDDLHFNVNITVAEGDKVAVFVTGSEHNKNFDVSTLYTACGVFRFENGKIAELWAVEDGVSQLRQLGFQIIPPVKEKA